MEEWKWIKFTDLDGTKYDYTNVYEVSNMGRVRSYADKHGKLHSQPTGYFNLKPSKQGYVQVGLGHSRQIGLGHNKRKFFKVHKLVVFMFIGECPKELLDTGEMICINHKNELKHDNRAENLEWCTNKQNVNYGTAIERRSKTITGHECSEETRQKIGKGTSKSVIATHVETGQQIVFDKVKDVAEYFDIRYGSVREHILKQKTVKNYVLQYR